MADRCPLGWLSLLLWVLASGAGWGLIPFLVLGIVLPVFGALFSRQTVMGMSEFSYAFQGAIFGIILGVLFGVVISVLQWLVLRRHTSQSYWWIAATVAGLGLGTPLGIVALRPLFAGPTSIGGPSWLYFVLLAAIVPGIVVGLLQRLVLRWYLNGTWWWLLPSALTWPVSLLYTLEGGGEVSLAVGRAGYLAELGLVLGTISGIALLLISRRRKEGVTGPVRAAVRRCFSKLVLVITAVLLLVLISAAIPSVTHTCGVVDDTFPDPNLESAIREAIDKPRGPIPISDLERVETLIVSERGISELSGLEHCVNLTELNLEGNQISDVSALASLTNLTTLHLGGNLISDLSPLASLTNLTTLILYGNGISDVSALASLTNLTTLHLEGNQISDVSVLASLTNLHALGLYRNQMSDVSSLASLTNLTSLDLYGNGISDVSALASLTNLTSLSLGGNGISDVSPLASLNRLIWLNLEGNQISDASPLASLTNLTIELNLGGNQISDVSPLASLTNLTALNLNDNQISDLSPLVENHGLGSGDYLWLKGNNLDLRAGSEAMENIRALEERGVRVHLHDEPAR